MKNGFLGAILIAIFAVSAAQADDGQMSPSKLSNLGLASMQPATDVQGMEVRGQGRAFASGAFIATAATTTSGVLSYNFQTRRNNATAFGNGQAVAEYVQLFNGTNFTFAAQAFGNSFAYLIEGTGIQAHQIVNDGAQGLRRCRLQ